MNGTGEVVYRGMMNKNKEIEAMSTERVAILKWYHFGQNNSFGELKGPHHVVVQASSAEEANKAAIEHADVYFDHDFYRDCRCCGERWTEVTERDVIAAEHGLHPSNPIWPSPKWAFSGAECLAVYADGTKKTAAVKSKRWVD